MYGLAGILVLSMLMNALTYASLGKYMDLLLDAICVVDKEGQFLYVSAGCERIFGYTPEEMLGRRMIELVLPEDRELTLQTVQKIVSGTPQPHFENRYLRKDGEVVHIMWSARWSEADQCRIAVARDITLRKRNEAMQAALYAISEAAHTTDDLPALFEQIHQIIGDLLPANNFSIALYDEETTTVSFPYHIDERAGKPEAHSLDAHSIYTQVIRSGQTLLLSQDGAEAVAELIQHFDDIWSDSAYSWLVVPLKTRETTVGALVVKSYAGHVHYSDKHRELLQFVSTQIATAIERKQMLARLQRLALYDQLTQLPNRGLFHDRIRGALARAKRHQEQLALLYLDLDKFKQVNDVFGHTIGDMLLEKVARRLELCVRSCDTVARFGGDEFVVLLENIDVPERATWIAEHIENALGQVFDLAGEQVQIETSVGIAHYPQHGTDEKELLRYADQAMYKIKKQK